MRLQPRGVAQRKNNRFKKLHASRGAQDTLSYFAPRRESEPLTIPTRWLKLVVGFFLLPAAGILTQTFFTCLSHETIQHAFWATEEFWFFALGAILWTIAFFGLPRPLLIYVFGHELTHYIWVRAMGGHVSEFKVSRNGGYIVTDKHNFWIALTPYFIPIYSLFVILLWGVASLFCDLRPHVDWLYALIGVTWAFHACFTLWMIPKIQSDLTSHGTFFSLVVILILNIALLSVLLIVASPHVSFRLFAHELFENTLTFSTWTRDRVRTWL